MSDAANDYPLDLLDTQAPLLPLQTVKDYLNYPVNDTSDDELLTLLLAAASDFVGRYVGPAASAVTFVERHDGWNGDTILLNHAPLVSITQVTEYRSTGGLVVLPLSTPENPVDGYQVEWETGMLIRVFQGNWPRTFFPGSRNIEVTYVAGYPTPPPLLQLALCELVAHWWQQGHQQAAGPERIQGSYDDVEVPGAWSGVPYRVLDKLDVFREPNLA